MVYFILIIGMINIMFRYQYITKIGGICIDTKSSSSGTGDIVKNEEYSF